MSDSGKEASSSNPATTTPHLGSGEYQPLVPLRVDVSLAGTNKASPSTPSLRIVETILFDPWVWPLKPKKLNDQTEWIEDNARYLAHNLLTDLEVQSMGRTIRHFTNRSDIWSIELQRKVMDQLRPQLQIVADMRQKNQRKRRRDETLFLRVEDDSTKKSRTSKVKQEENEMDDSIEKNETETETKPQSTVTSEGVASASTPLADEKEVKGESSSASKDPAEKMSDEASLSHLIPIQIRLSVHGIRITHFSTLLMKFIAHRRRRDFHHSSLRIIASTTSSRRKHPFPSLSFSLNNHHSECFSCYLASE